MTADRGDLIHSLADYHVYFCAADYGFADARRKVPLRILLSLYNTESSELSQWHIPETHYLESWGDARAYDGTTTIMQPLINPLYAGKSAYELLSIFFRQPTQSGYDILRDYWKDKLAEDFESSWRKAVHD